MKKTFTGLFVLLGIVLIPGATYAASCQTESDYLKRAQELTALSPRVLVNKQYVNQLTPALTAELKASL